MDKEKIHKEKMAALKSAWDLAKKDADFIPSLKLLNKKQLEEIAIDSEALGIKHVQIVASGPGGRICPACKELHDNVFTLESELKKPHLPNNKCECTAYNEDQTGFCLCYYEIIFEDEL